MTRAPRMVAVAGASCSGKTELARHLAKAWPGGGASVVAMDAYYRDLGHLPAARRAEENFDHPDALDHDLLVEHLQALARGEPIAMPVYSFEHHTRTSRTETIRPGSAIVVEGLHALYFADLRELMHSRIFVDVSPHVALARRIARDATERGRTEESVRAQYAGAVLPMQKRYVEPCRRLADLVISGDALASEVVDIVTAWLFRR